ncbi:hypothetical protein GQX73_g7454 [Xylaria multiplex]|uniref:Heterokaryon incompatibility domain-containing protein n=1 Tax=Xylaria multiplex TaxID=323545 RepID=A0A7C8MML4_9PEZI|nr:hypothetical protein GQX73_g7454 [Xylaria multiplex]
MKFGLETFNINNCPEYATLSYCWGEQSPPSTIVANDQHFIVSPNLADALHHVWPYLHSQTGESKFFLWVDQICINQNDEEERADQVQLMRELYSSSSFTIAWLGSPDDSSNIALELLTRERGVYSAPGRGIQLHPHKEQRKEYYEKRALLRKLDDRPYWKRMWIMQEFILPPKLLILCGPTGVWWDDMRRSHGMNNEFCIHMAPLFKRRYMMHSEGIKFQFVRLLNIAKYRACTRPFDRIFALLGLAMPDDLRGLQVDYNMPTQTLYRNVVRLLERVVKSEKAWVRLTQDLAEALDLQPSERALTPPSLEMAFTYERGEQGVGMAESAKSFRQTVGVPPSTASTSDSTLVIIDAQNEYAIGLLKTENIESTRAANATLLEKYRAANAPIVHVVHKTPDGAPVFTPGTTLAAEFDELQPRDSESVVVKQAPGSFTGTQLQEILEKTGRKKVVLTGYMAHVCVSTTARQAAEKGWDVIIPKDAVGDRHIPGVDAAELVRVALSEIADAFGTIIESKEIS